MLLLLTLSLLSLPPQTAQAIDTTQVALLRLQLQSQMQETVKDQALRVDSLAKVVTEVQSSLRFYERTGSLAVIALSIAGLSFIVGFVKRSTRKFEKAIDDAIYRVDPRDMPIRLPETGMEKQIERLKRLDFRNLSTYRWLDDSCTRYAVLYLATNDEEAEVLKKFIQERNLGERDDVAFVVFTRGMSLKQTIFAGIENVTFANTPLTLVQALFVVARGIVRKAK